MRNFPIQYHLTDRDALYFPHIPKTAGMTFRTILEDYFHCHEICPATLNAQFADIKTEDLDRYRLYRGHLSYIDIPRIVTRKQVIPVTILREPVPRVISHYDYIRRTPGDPYYESVKEMTLEEFTQKLPVGKVGKNVQVYYIAKIANYDINRLPPDEVLEIAKESLDQFAFVGLLERFQDSLFLLSYIFGWKPILNSRKENAANSSKGKLAEKIPASTLDLIRESTFLDQQLYDYAQDIFNTRFDGMMEDLLAKYANKFSLDFQPNSAPSVSPEITSELLEEHAKQCYFEFTIPASNTLFYDFCQPLRGAGWHRRECPPKELAYRWIGPETQATLELPLAVEPETNYLLELRIICTWVVTLDMLASLVVEVNGYPVPFITLHMDQDVKLVQGIVPGKAFASDEPLIYLKLSVNRVTSLRDAEPLNRDTRSVGLAINCVQLFPEVFERNQSASLLLFEDVAWQETVDFMHRYLKPGERVVAPLAFKVKLSNEVWDYSKILANQTTPFQWVILHKGMVGDISRLLIKLMVLGFRPTFANAVFIVFTRSKAVPKLGYLSSHVRSLYLGRIKAYIQLVYETRLKPWRTRNFGRQEVIRDAHRPRKMGRLKRQKLSEASTSESFSEE